jgi:hypothetical protein
MDLNGKPKTTAPLKIFAMPRDGCRVYVGIYDVLGFLNFSVVQSKTPSKFLCKRQDRIDNWLTSWGLKKQWLRPVPYSKAIAEVYSH